MTKSVGVNQSGMAKAVGVNEVGNGKISRSN